jgi:FHA domain
MPKLVVFRGDAIEREVVLTGRSLRIGRDPQNDLVLNDPANGVSRFHAEIRAEGGTYTIVDLKSRNGVWVDRRRVQSVVLKVGAPLVTIGACQIGLEDESGLSDPDVAADLAVTVVGPPKGAVQPQHNEATAPVRIPSSRASSQRGLLFAGVAVAVLAVVGISFALRSSTPPSAPAPIAGDGNPAPPPPSPPADDEKTLTRNKIDKHLSDAREQMARGDYEGAVRDHLDPALELDPQNGEAETLKIQAAAELAKIANAKPPQPARPKTPEAVVVSVPGIPRLATETNQQYEERAKRVQDNYLQGKQQLDQKQYAAAIRKFEAVEQDQGSYRDVRALIDVAGQRSAALRDSMEAGAKNESAGQLKAAIQSYRRAEQYDATGSAAERAKTVLDRLVKENTAKFDSTEKRLEPFRAKWPDAIKVYQEIADALPEGEELRERALQKVKTLK